MKTIFGSPLTQTPVLRKNKLTLPQILQISLWKIWQKGYKQQEQTCITLDANISTPLFLTRKKHPTDPICLCCNSCFSLLYLEIFFSIHTWKSCKPSFYDPELPNTYFIYVSVYCRWRRGTGEKRATCLSHLLVDVHHNLNAYWNWHLDLIGCSVVWYSTCIPFSDTISDTLLHHVENFQTSNSQPVYKTQKKIPIQIILKFHWKALLPFNSRWGDFFFVK